MLQRFPWFLIRLLKQLLDEIKTLNHQVTMVRNDETNTTKHDFKASY